MKRTLALCLLLPALLLAQEATRRLPPERLLQQFDANGDGKISRDEAPDRMQQRWGQIDGNADGFITLEELKARDERVSRMDQRDEPPAAAAVPESPKTAPAVIAGSKAFVNAAGAPARRDGKSWATAFATVQDALSAGAAEIWVARGTYMPGTAREATFRLCKGGELYGGFAGTETRREQRDWQKNKTILDGKGAYHVVTGADDAILDGFVITGGNGMGGQQDGPPSPGAAGGRPVHITPQIVMSGVGSGSGAGMVNYHASPTVRNCIFENNQAGKGGGVYNMTSTTFPPRPGAAGKTPVFVNCVFRHNTARGRGAGVSNDLGTSPTFLNCVFEENETPQKGGGMYNDFGCSPTLINCLFTGNSAQSAGGLGNDGASSPVLYFCTFTKNHAVDYGAPLYQGTGPANNPALLYCVITNNVCDWEDPGVYNWHDNTPLIKNGADAGYRPDRFTEAQLSQLLAELTPYKAQPVRESMDAAPDRIPSSQRVIAVRGDGKALQAALEDAGRDGAEVRLAPGTYRLSGERSDCFVLRPGVRVCGEGKAVLAGNGAYHVLVGANGAVLDGLTITGGRADGTGYDGKGGGLINYRRAPQGRPNAEVVNGFAMTFNRCVFTNNYARDGGAVYSYDRAKPVFKDCVFAGNGAENGGAVMDRVGVESCFESCVFDNNAAKWRGGALYFDYGSRPAITGCLFRGNSTSGHGGAIFSVSRASQLENTIVTAASTRFEKNTSGGYGGALAFCDSSLYALHNCTFSGNMAVKDGKDTYADETSSPTDGAARQPAAREGRPEGQLGRQEGTFGQQEGGFGRPEAGQAGSTFKPTADFSVVIVGSGSPQYDPKRSGPSALIQHRGSYVLVDMGNGTQARLSELGVSLRDVSALMLTHHHIDHNEEFIPILVYRLLRGRDVGVIGPAGTEKMVGFARDAYKEDMAYRMERRGRTLQDAGRANVREVRGGEQFSLGDLRVTTAEVPHSITTVAYRFEADERSIVISGDLTYSTNLVQLARGADVLVMDSGGALVRQGGHPGGGGDRQPTAHPSAQDVRNMAQQAGVKKLVLTHVVGSNIDDEATVSSIRETFKGTVIVGADLLEVVPAR